MVSRRGSLLGAKVGLAVNSLKRRQKNEDGSCGRHASPAEAGGGSTIGRSGPRNPESSGISRIATRRSWSKLWESIVGAAPAGAVPLRIQAALVQEQRKGEVLIGWVQAAILLLWGALYAVSPKTFPDDASFQPVPWTLAVYALFLALRIWLAHNGKLSNWMVTASIVMDIAVLMLLIWSFHLQYGQPPAFYLKAPTLLYVFIFITLRTLRFEARWILLAGAAGAVGWLGLLLFAIGGSQGGGHITRDYVEYMTSPSILLGAEVDKIISIVIVSGVLAVALQRARRLMERAAIDHAAAAELSRFVASGVAETISSSDTEIQPGQAEARVAAALFVDLRGFTALARELRPAELMALLGEYQKRVIPIVQRHRGQIDKFLGDGIFASFGAVRGSTTFAADALAAVDEIVLDLTQWIGDRQSRGLAAPEISAAVTSGEVLFGVVGDESRLEYTIIGDPVNVAAKLEKHTRVEEVTALTDVSTFKLALKQGYRPQLRRGVRIGRRVSGIAHPIDLVVIAQ